MPKFFVNPSAMGLLSTLCCLLAGAAQAASPTPSVHELLGPAHSTLPSLENLPRPSAPPAERGLVVPAQVQRWRDEAKALEYGDGVPRDAVSAAQLYCRAARHGDAQAQYNLAWMLTNSRGIERDEAQAAHLFAAAAEQGFVQAKNILEKMGGSPRGAPPSCLVQPETDAPLVAAAKPTVVASAGKPGARLSVLPPVPVPANAPPQIVKFVQLVAPEYQLEPHLVLAIMATESNFDANALSPKNAHGLMQLIPETAARFGVRNIKDPVQNIRGGMAYLRWLMAYFEGDVVLVAAAYNAGEGAVDRYRGVPPYAETRAYVGRILVGVGFRGQHRFDSNVAPPSGLLALLRTAPSPSLARPLSPRR